MVERHPVKREKRYAWPPAGSSAWAWRSCISSPASLQWAAPTSEPGRDSDERQHKVTLTQGFYLQTMEVTQGQWKRVMGSNPSRYKNCGDGCPVKTVSWNDAQVFIKKLNQMENTTSYRLPTEAEWEYAARAGTKTVAFSDCLSTSPASYHGDFPMPGCGEDQSREQPVPVGRLSANAWGLYDMHGNVYEWYQDWYLDYPTGSMTDPQGPRMGEDRVLSSDGWYERAGDCRSAHPDVRHYILGLRLIMTQLDEVITIRGRHNCCVNAFHPQVHSDQKQASTVDF